MKKLKYTGVVLFLLLGYGACSQNQTNDGLVLIVQNEKIYYQPKNIVDPFDENIRVSFDNIIQITLTNKSDSPYLIVIDTTTFMLHDHIKEEYEEYNIIRDSNAISNPHQVLFRPRLKIYDSTYIPVSTGWFFYRLHYKSESSKEQLKQMGKNIEQRDKAYLLYGYLQKEELDDMPEYYYKVKQKQHIIYPKDTLNLFIPVSLPDNHDISIGEYYKLEGNSSYKAVVEMDNPYNDLKKILTQKDIDSLKNVGIKIFNGVLRSNEIELLPIKQ
jgi:hypothetical protein